jgi:hypothetical protein
MKTYLIRNRTMFWNESTEKMILDAIKEICVEINAAKTNYTSFHKGVRQIHIINMIHKSFE